MTFKVISSTMGRSTPATVNIDADNGQDGYYRWHKIPGWVPNDPRCKPETSSGPAIGKADKAARLAEFAGYLKQGLTAQQAGRLVGIAAKTARTYDRELKEQQPETVLEPAEIVRRLHREIAAQSPEHAALVADFERIAPFIPRPAERGGLDEHNRRLMAERDARMRGYAALRASGLTKKQARLHLELSETAGNRYEADMHLVSGEVPE